MIRIEVNIDDATLAAGLHKLVEAARDTTPLMRQLAGIMHNATEEAFDQQRDPVTGTPWVKHSTAYARQRAEMGKMGKILQLNGGLATSISRQYGNGFARVGTNKPYAAIHQFGGTTRAHVIRAKFKKALNIPGIGPRKKVNHPGSTIPRRRFLGIGPEHKEDMCEAITKYLQTALHR